MAILGAVVNVKKNLQENIKFKVAFEYIKSVMTPGSLENLRLLNTPIGAFEKYSLTHGCYALEQVYYSKERTEAFFESHLNYIDVQFLLKGEEIIEILKPELLVVDSPYDMNRDLIKYTDPGSGSSLRLSSGDVAILFPEDAHMPGLTSTKKMVVYKTVVKVPVND